MALSPQKDLPQQLAQDIRNYAVTVIGRAGYGRKIGEKIGDKIAATVLTELFERELFLAARRGPRTDFQRLGFEVEGGNDDKENRR